MIAFSYLACFTGIVGASLPKHTGSAGNYRLAFGVVCGAVYSVTSPESREKVANVAAGFALDQVSGLPPGLGRYQQSNSRPHKGMVKDTLNL